VIRRAFERSTVFRFLLSGGLNTALTYLLYLGLLLVLDYWVAYTLSFVAGIALSYLINRKLVFRAARSWLSALLFPTVYLAQYVIGLCVVHVWIKMLVLPAALAPLAAVAVTLPVTFILSRAVFALAGPRQPGE
jgi:putative flippase GtrA